MSAYVCTALDGSGQCSAWVDLAANPALLSEIGITSSEIAAVAGQTAGGVLLMWVIGLTVGHVAALIKHAIQGD